MGKTSIEWCDYSWPVVNGCRRVSAGCENCYAERLTATRLSKSPKYGGLAVMGKNGPRWTGETRLWAPHLAQPLRIRKPSRIFVADMGDLFYERVESNNIAAVFGVMAACPQHTFQVLTKRPARMVDWFKIAERSPPWVMNEACYKLGREETFGIRLKWDHRTWPLPNVWLGVSVEDQATADERIPLLLQTPAAVRFVSYEPALGAVDFEPWIFHPTRCRACGSWTTHYDPNPKGLPTRTCSMGGEVPRDGEPGAIRCTDCASLDIDELPSLDWIIVGGESGPRARPFDVGWARSTIRQCREAGVAVFCKQLGSRPTMWAEDSTPVAMHLNDRKGGDMSEWPEDLRVREFPAVPTP